MSDLAYCIHDAQLAIGDARHHLAYLRALVVIDTDAAFAGETLAPETVNGRGGGWHSIMSEEQPETENRLGEDVKDGVTDDLTINREGAGTISKTPDDRVDGPENEGETSNGSEEGGSLRVLLGNDSTAVEGELVDDDEIGNAGHGVVSPSSALLVGQTGEETSQDHDDIGNNGNRKAGTVQASKETEIDEQEWGGDAPVDVTSPVDLTMKGLVGGVSMLVLLLEGDSRVTDALAGGHGEVGDSSESGDEGSQDVEESFLGWHTVGHGIEG